MIKLYHTGCPQCRGIEQRLKSKNIQYEEIKDINLMIERGFTTAPVIENDGHCYVGGKECSDFLRTLGA